MTPQRRRTKSGIPLAVIIAVLAAVFASRAPRTPAAAPSARTAPTAAAQAPSPDRAAPASSATPAADDSPGFASRQRWIEHFEKHGAEFPGLDADGYLRAAQQLRDAPAGGEILEVRRKDGVITRFDRGSGAFLAANRDRTIRTFFRPNDGESYFRRQASRTPGGGP
jgi:hypothetical protein